MVLYGIARFVIEFWRDDARGEWLGLSTSQWLGLPLIAACVVFYIVLSRRRRRIQEDKK